MNIYPIEAGNFKLDGGAMFGIVPKSLWSRVKSADENNMCSWSTRCLLIENGSKLILIDTGIGDKQSEKFFSYYYLFGDDTLLKSIEKRGFSREDITDVILTHLHFDHCGGAVSYNREKERYETTFPNATYWSNEKHWDWALNPNAREKASFLKENMLPIQEAGQLKFINRQAVWNTESELPGLRFYFADGHTESQMIPSFDYKEKSVIYMADLLPSTAHIPLPWVMGYDVRPLETLKEKKFILDSAADGQHLLIFEHDIDNECALVEYSEKGVRLKEAFKLEEFFGN